MIQQNERPASVFAPRGGARIGGKIYRDGDMLPERYRRVMEAASSRAVDPASRAPGVPPNLGRSVVPHVMTFRGIYTSLAKAYRISDEALRSGSEHAELMRKDDAIMGPLLARQMMTSLFNWHIEPEDNTPELKAVAREVTDLLKRTPFFEEYRRNLLEALWYGRSAVQNRWGVRYDRYGKRRYFIRQWTPVHGDKIMFRYDDGTGEYDPDQIGFRVSPLAVKNDKIAGERKVELTPHGPCVFLEPWERSLVSLHRYLVQDAPFHDPLGGGSIHGVGIRHFIYWTWYAKQETLAQLLELVERTALGITIYRYPSGNAAAQAEVEQIAKQQAHTNVLLMPSDPEDPNAYLVEKIPLSDNGIQVLQEMVSGHFGRQIVQFILGQTLSRDAAATGLGSGVADLHEESLMQLAQYDSVALEETLTEEVVRRLIEFNFPDYAKYDFHFRISTKSAGADRKLQAISQAFQMGAKIRTADVMDIIGLAMPKGNDDFLSQEQLQQAAQMGVMPGLQMGGGAADSGSGLPPGEGDRMPPSITTSDGPEEEQADTVEKKFGPVLYAKDAAERVRDAVARCVEPTEAQRKAGNYYKPRVVLHGLPIAIETPKGKRRRPEWPPMGAHYGYISRTEGADGDHVDVLIGPHPDSQIVFVVDQEDARGRFDEHKVLLGFYDQRDAVRAYLAGYNDNRRLGPVTALTIRQFRAWLARFDQRQPINRTPFARYARLQKGLFGEDFEPETPKPAKKPKAEPKFSQPTLFGVSGKAGQKDFLGEMDDNAVEMVEKPAAKKEWREEDHPRDDEGKFAEKERRHRARMLGSESSPKSAAYWMKTTPGGVKPWEMTEAQWVSFRDPLNGAAYADGGKRFAEQHEAFVHHGLIYDQDSVPNDVLFEYADKLTIAQNVLAERNRQGVKVPQPEAVEHYIADWDESAHPREGAGTEKGGQFAPKGTTATVSGRGQSQTWTSDGEGNWHSGQEGMYPVSHDTLMGWHGRGGREVSIGSGPQAAPEQPQQDDQEIRAAAVAKLREGLEMSAPKHAEQYAQWIDEATKNATPRALELIASRVKDARFFDSPTALAKTLYGRASKGLMAAGAWSVLPGAQQGTLFLDSHNRSEKGVEVYMHELGHVVDSSIGAGGEISGTPEWRQAWSAEIGRRDAPLSAYATQDPHEGFAEFYRLCLLDSAAAQQHFPQSWAIMKKQQLVA